MPRLYSVPIDNGSITNASGDYDLVELDPATDKLIEICGWDFGQLSELQEAQEEHLRFIIGRGHTTDGTGGSSVTPVPLNPSDAAAGFTADVLRTGIASGGTNTVMWAFDMPVRSGHQWGPVPEGYGFQHVGSNLLVVRLVAAVVDDLTFQGSVMVREY
jgi:hypothetical protein